MSLTDMFLDGIEDRINNMYEKTKERREREEKWHRLGFRKNNEGKFELFDPEKADKAIKLVEKSNNV